WGEKVEPDGLREIERDERRLDERVEPAHEPVHVLGFDAVVMLQEAAHEAEPGRAVLRGADALALELLRRGDARTFAHIEAGVAEALCDRDGTRHERTVAARLQRRVGGKRQLGNLKLLVIKHALEALARAQHLDVEIDAIWLDAAVHQRTGAVVVPAGERE